MNEKNYPSYLDNPKPTRKQTNSERIRNMNTKEMATMMIKLSKCEEKDCTNCPLWTCQHCENIEGVQQWLESEVEEWN